MYIYRAILIVLHMCIVKKKSGTPCIILALLVIPTCCWVPSSWSTSTTTPPLEYSEVSLVTFPCPSVSSSLHDYGASIRTLSSLTPSHLSVSSHLQRGPHIAISHDARAAKFKRSWQLIILFRVVKTTLLYSLFFMSVVKTTLLYLLFCFPFFSSAKVSSVLNV